MARLDGIRSYTIFMFRCFYYKNGSNLIIDGGRTICNFSIKNNSHIKLFKETNNKFLIIFLALVICFFELIGISLIFPIISLLFD